MSAMSRLATELVLAHSGEIDASQQFTDTLVALGYEPDERPTEVDVAGDVIVACSDCGSTDLSAEMVDQSAGEFLCVACDHENFREWQDAMNERWKR